MVVIVLCKDAGLVIIDPYLLDNNNVDDDTEIVDENGST